MAYWRVGGGKPVNETANCRLHIMNIFRNKFKEELRDKSANIYFGEVPHQTHFTLSPPLNKQRGLPQPITTLIPCSVSCSGHNKLHLLACVDMKMCNVENNDLQNQVRCIDMEEIL